MKGFTLIEILVAITILLILSSIGVSNFTTYNDTQSLRQTSLTLKNRLRQIQGKALAGEKPAGCTGLQGWRMTFTTSTYTTEVACTSGAVTSSRTTETVPVGLIFSPVPSTITFSVVTGATNLTSVQSLNLAQAGSGKQYTIGVGPRGEITDEGMRAYVAP